MDGVIETLIRTLVDPGETVAVSTPTFSFYGLAAKAQGAEVITVPRERDFSVRAEETDLCRRRTRRSSFSARRTTLRATRPASKLSGKFSKGSRGPLPRQRVRRVLGLRLPSPDEEVRQPRYRHGHSRKCTRLPASGSGTRLCPAWLVPFYQRAATPFTVNAVSAAAAAAALTDKGHADRYIAQVRSWRKRFADEVKYPGPPVGRQLCDDRCLPGHVRLRWWGNLRRKGLSSARAGVLPALPIIISGSVSAKTGRTRSSCR